MANKRSNSQTQKLEDCRVALGNAENQPEIATAMAELSYDAEKIKEGKQLLKATQSAFNFNKQEDSETVEARDDYDSKTKILTELYRKDRKKAKIAFRNDTTVLTNLNLKGIIPKAFAPWIAAMKDFYLGLLADEDAQQKVAKFKFTKKDMQAGLNAIIALEKSRSEYMREKGESQEATSRKDAAFAKLDAWMRDFLDVAKIAMEDKPQLLEALGLRVRS